MPIFRRVYPIYGNRRRFDWWYNRLDRELGQRRVARPDWGDLVGAVPGLGDVADVRTQDFSNVPSPHFSVEQMLESSRVCTEYGEYMVRNDDDD